MSVSVGQLSKGMCCNSDGPILLHCSGHSPLLSSV